MSDDYQCGYAVGYANGFEKACELDTVEQREQLLDQLSAVTAERDALLADKARLLEALEEFTGQSNRNGCYGVAEAAIDAAKEVRGE